jgi:hypothetical protein
MECGPTVIGDPTGSGSARGSSARLTCCTFLMGSSVFTVHTAGSSQGLKRRAMMERPLILKDDTASVSGSKARRPEFEGSGPSRGTEDTASSGA